LLFVVACSSPVQEPTRQEPVSQEPVRQEPVRQEPPAAIPEITIETVEVANPVVISGRARTFENNVVLRVRDARGELIAEDFTTSAGEMGQHNPYRGSVWLTRDPGARVTVEALEYSAKDGSERSLTRAQRPFNVEPIDVTLRVPNDDCTGLVNDARRVPKSVAMARLLVELLLELPVFPKGSAVNSVNIRDGVLTVDFNERLQNVGGSCAALMIRASVTETLQQLPTVKRVVITAGGSEKLALQP
jgi:hypothetical protein